MSIVKINAISVPAGAAAELERRFSQRAGVVERSPGFLGFQLLRPVQDLNPQAPRELCDLIHRCLAFDPPQRPARMGEVQGTLDHMADRLIRSPEDRLEMMSGE